MSFLSNSYSQGSTVRAPGLCFCTRFPSLSHIHSFCLMLPAPPAGSLGLPLRCSLGSLPRRAFPERPDRPGSPWVRWQPRQPRRPCGLLPYSVPCRPLMSLQFRVSEDCAVFLTLSVQPLAQGAWPPVRQILNLSDQGQHGRKVPNS